MCTQFTADSRNLEHANVQWFFFCFNLWCPTLVFHIFQEFHFNIPEVVFNQDTRLHCRVFPFYLWITSLPKIISLIYELVWIRGQRRYSLSNRYYITKLNQIKYCLELLWSFHIILTTSAHCYCQKTVVETAR